MAAASDPGAARTALEAALRDLQAQYHVETPSHADVRVALGRALAAEGRAAEAAPHADAAVALWQQVNPDSVWHREALALQAAVRTARQR